MSDDRRHHFEITVRLRGDESADYWDTQPRPQTVRAWNLHDALVTAARLPLHWWFDPEEEQ